MDAFRWTVTVLFAVLVAGAVAQSPEAGLYALSGEVRYGASFELGDIDARNDTVVGEVELGGPEADAPWQRADGQVCVRMAAWESDNALRDADARGLFDAREHPEACFAPSRLHVGADATEIVGRLQLRDVRRDLAMPGTLTRDGDAFRFRGSIEVSLSDWELRAPRFLFFVVHDEVTIEVDVRATPVAGGSRR